jgi:DNA-binding Lrp family transcriptional regulator
MKEVELKLVAELMKNSRRSDRELAKAIGVSQPTVSRTIEKLEKQGIIKEYTMIPDFAKIGYTLLTVTLVKHREGLDRKQLEEEAKKGLERAQTGEPPEMVMAETGIGLGYDAVVIAYVEDYTAHRRLIEKIRSFEHLQASETQSFIVNLTDQTHYRPFTYQTLAEHLLTMQKQVT